MNWLASPLIPYLLFTFLLVLQLWLFLACKREVAMLRRAHESMTKDFGGRLDVQGALVGGLAGDVQELKDEPRPSVPAAAISMNLTKRHQVIRQARNGESAAQIAATLQMPRREVELLLKVHKGIHPPGKEKAPEPSAGAGA